MSKFHIKPLFWVVLFFLAACSTGKPTPTTVFAVETIPVVRPTITVAMQPTIEPSQTDALPTTQPSQTPRPSATILPTVTVATMPAPTIGLVELFDLETLPDLAWTNAQQVVAIIDEAVTVSWSPTTNEFASNNCNGPLGYTSVVKLLKASAPDFLSIDITPGKDEVHSLCNNVYDDLVWTPNGQELIFAGKAEEGVFLDGSLWIMNNQGQNARLINPEVTNNIWMPDPIGWFGPYELFYTSYSGGGSVYGHIVNVQTGNLIRTIGTVWGGIGTASRDYIAIHQNAPTLEQDTAGVIPISESHNAPPNAVESDRPLLAQEPYIYWLSLDFGSTFLDWLTGTNDMLVATWEEGVYFRGAARTDLQLWRVDDGELVLLVPNGRDGNFSPDGRYLAYLLPTNESDEFEDLEFHLEILDRQTGQVIFSRPSDDSVPIWSPGSERLVFNHPTDGLTVLNVLSGAFAPLAESGVIRLRQPKWSYDGRYLSLGVWQQDGTWSTAVIQVSQ